MNTNNEIQINGNDSEWELKCKQIAEDHKPFNLVNFKLDKMHKSCKSIAKQYAYELKITLEPPCVCHFIPRAFHNEAVPLEFSGSSED